MSGAIRQAFLDDILAHPDDDAPRLIFADWLEEEGDAERAEFIRVQIERARLPFWDARQVRLWLRESQLLKQHEEKWKQELPTIEGVEWQEFRRGFVGAAAFDGYGSLQTNAKVCWGAAPIAAATIGPWLRQNLPRKTIAPISGLRELRVDQSWFRPNEIKRLASAPFLSTLRTLKISDSNLSVNDFRQLAASPHLGNVTTLRLPDNYIGNGSVEILAGATSLSSLTELDLSQSGGGGQYFEDPILNPSGLRELAQWPGLARLRSLNLSGHAAGRSGVRSLLHSKHLSQLKELILSENTNLGPEAMEEFGAARPKLKLDILDLSRNVLRNAGAENLAAAPCLCDLKVLNLERCEIHMTGARRLAEAEFLANLRVLDVNDNSFGPNGLRAILKANPKHLHTLDIRNNELDDEGVVSLAASPAAETLQDIDLSRNGLSTKAAKALAQSKHLKNLLLLRLAWNQIDRGGRASLKRSALGKRVSILGLEHHT
jgi:uncharacterized protein (TIGR02996 family)